ncbi:hypothetical protein BT69DRAFT_1223584 [Atractiella rhizophila]|nr:hypothetical protein BT69DRAFT_1223584 [Atractiella rhizophila]
MRPTLPFPILRRVTTLPRPATSSPLNSLRGFPFTTTSAWRATSSCPECHTTLTAPAPLCPSCSKPLAPPSSSELDYRTLFSIPKTYYLSREALESLKKEYRRLQGVVHPDRALGKEVWAREWSARVNEGLRTLEDDFKRAEWMVRPFLFLEIGESDQLEDPDLLISILETREKLEAATAEEEVEEIRAENRVDMDQTIEDLKEALDGQPRDLDRGKELLIRLRYLRNVEDVCREWQPGKGVVLQH